MMWIIGGVLLGLGLLICAVAPTVGAWIALAGAIIIGCKIAWTFFM